MEMDTVLGVIGGKLIMTFHFTVCNFMFGILLDNKYASEAAAKVRALKAHLSAHGVSFGSVFPLILTDNGGEFADIHAFMDNLSGEHETDLFFCEPFHSSEKPKVEKNHTMFRDIAPKGTSFDSWTQEDVNFIFSHVNSVCRNMYLGKTPFQLFSFLYEKEELCGKDPAALFGIREIPADDVIQAPRLLKMLPSVLKK